MELNWIAISVVTLGHFILGALWFSVFFGKQWMWIHHGTKTPNKKELEEMDKGMWKMMIVELAMTGLITAGLAVLVQILSTEPHMLAGEYIGFVMWVSFIFPMIVSSTLWGNDRKDARIMKVLISSLYRLAALMASGYILAMW